MNLISPNNPIIQKIKALSISLSNPLLPSATIYLESLFETNSPEFKKFIKNTYNMGGSFQLSEFNTVSTKDCRTSVDQNRIKSIDLNLTFTDELYNWAFYTPSGDKKEKIPEKPDRVGQVKVVSGILKTDPRPQAFSEIKNLTLESSAKLVSCYSDLAKKQYNAPLL